MLTLNPQVLHAVYTSCTQCYILDTVYNVLTFYEAPLIINKSLVLSVPS